MKPKNNPAKSQSDFKGILLCNGDCLIFSVAYGIFAVSDSYTAIYDGSIEEIAADDTYPSSAQGAMR